MRQPLAVLGGVVCLLLLISCNGDDGKDGRAVAKFGWTPDITAADFSQVGVPPPIYGNRIYVLRPGPGTVYWVSSGLVYGLQVTVDPGIPGEKGSATLLIIPKKGSDGQDRAYTVVLSGGVLYFSEQVVPIGASFALSDAPQLPGDLDRENALQGRYDLGLP
jgi:hypothetical protein